MLSGVIKNNRRETHPTIFCHENWQLSHDWYLTNRMAEEVSDN